MRISIILVALMGFSSAATLKQMASAEPCEEALPVTAEELEIQLDYLSRRLDMKYYENAMKIYEELRKQGQNPTLDVHTFELYDKAFSFPRVRRYDFVEKHLNQIQHYQDNLNQNFTTGLAVKRFLEVSKLAQKEINAKYHDGEFSDPAKFDPLEEHPITWSNVVL